MQIISLCLLTVVVSAIRQSQGVTHAVDLNALLADTAKSFGISPE
jgi:hypothetical protein